MDEGFFGFLQTLDVEKVSNELTFSIGEVEFEMERMKGWAAWGVLDKLRSEVLAGLVAGNLQRVAALPTEFIEKELLEPMSKHLKFSTPQITKGKLPFAGKEDMALNPEFGVEPTAVYELVGRFLCINFPSLCRRIVKQTGSLGAS